jgi:hypothetical protein
MLDDAAIPDAVTGQARSAVLASAERIDRAMAASDVEQVIGGAKDLVECVSKIVIEAVGGTYASRDSLPRLAKEALTALKAHPAGFQARTPMHQLTAALTQVPSAVADLRNHDGTGHGRSSPTDLHPTSAEFAGHVALAWSKWVLAALARTLAGMAEVHDAIRRIETIGPDRSFQRGELRQLLLDLHLTELAPEQQRRLGTAVGRRSILGTTVANIDVVDPLAAGDEVFPEPFGLGVIEGLFIDRNGYLRSIDDAAANAAAIAERLGAQGEETLTGLAERVEQADLAYAFTEDESHRVVTELRQVAEHASSEHARVALDRMASRIETLLGQSAQGQPADPYRAEAVDD